ncbi:MAG: aldehyde dehydrogenase family protein [Parvicellaceae bacterium]
MTERINVLKTYKIFIDGKFPRTESGRFFQLKVNDIPVANVCLSSRKDLRNAVVAARKAFSKWSSASAYNRSQILYRMAEMLEGRKTQFIEELVLQGVNNEEALKEVNSSIDRIIYFAGWADKINQVFGSINPVASSHFNFSKLQPMGVVGIVAPEKTGLLGLISAICPVIVSGNSCVVITSESLPLSAITFSEALITSDLPAGTINILTGSKSELLPHLSKHMDINAIYLCDSSDVEEISVQIDAADNLKRIILSKEINWNENKVENPYSIIKFMETKTTWHPIENISINDSGY